MRYENKKNFDPYGKSADDLISIFGTNNSSKSRVPGRIVTDTNFLKKAMHIQIWKDTSSTMQFIIWHDTVYLLMLHADMKMQQLFGRSMCFMGTHIDTTGMTPNLQPIGNGIAARFWRRNPTNLHG